MDAPLLVAEGLVKRFGARNAVDGLELRCERGSVLGLLGPNGAGKTTTLRMLYGFLDPDEGSIRLLGRDFVTHRDELKRQIGVCTQDDSLDYDFSVAQNLEIYASYFRPRVVDVGARIDELLELFALREYRDASPTTLSGGFKRRLMLARSIVHRPQLLFLDEPTTGLDPSARVALWRIVDKLRSEGLGIILTTHYMDEAERLADRLLVISRGKTLAEGRTPEVLSRFLGGHVLVVPGKAPARDVIDRELREVHGLRPHQVLDELHVPVTAELFAELAARYPDEGLSLRRPTLDDLFLRLDEEGTL
jgi:lipooligosaccharide transport system ATP-binding protein